MQDEIHERDRFSDFLLIVLREMLPKMKNLRLVLMSAALNVQLFASYFSGCPIVSGNELTMKSIKVDAVDVKSSQNLAINFSK